MKVLFFTLVDIRTIHFHAIYEDLLRELAGQGNEITIISPIQRRHGKETYLIEEDICTILKVKTGNIQKSNKIEKGIATVLIEPQLKRAIKTYLSDRKFDLILYSTPPITFLGAIDYVKRRDHAKTYLLLKDIFPQNAVDIGMLSKTGLMGMVYRYFRRKEKKLYAVSDRIGCMSQANVDFLLKHNPEIDPLKVEISPNSIEVVDRSMDPEGRKAFRNRYGIPLDKKVIVYGGNLGKGQDISYLVDCIDRCGCIDDIFFLIAGAGGEYGILENFVSQKSPRNLKLMSWLPKEDYDAMVYACDIGLIVLDHRFTIPNFPSRLLTYMQARLPVLALTDRNTDLAHIVVEGGFGWWRESSDPAQCVEILKEMDKLAPEEYRRMGERGYQYLCEHYHVKQAVRPILDFAAESGAEQSCR
ncbi:MAG: glycosyltransferase family 4 protein [Blautia sp.]|nr:glycosyltransferase family 4 protein [Blautia sp.]